MDPQPFKRQMELLRSNDFCVDLFLVIGSMSLHVYIAHRVGSYDLCFQSAFWGASVINLIASFWIIEKVFKISLSWLHSPLQCTIPVLYIIKSQALFYKTCKVKLSKTFFRFLKTSLRHESALWIRFWPNNFLCARTKSVRILSKESCWLLLIIP